MGGAATPDGILRSAAAMVFVEDLRRPEPAEADAHHLGRVLRLRSGEAVVAADGAGGWRPCRWVAPEALEPDGEVRAEPAPRPELAVGFVPTKGERPEWTVQKLTELGVDRIVVASSARSVVDWSGPRGERHLVRLAEVARQAAMQSRRPRLPAVEGVIAFGALAAAGRWALALPGGPPPAPATTAVLVGPEGGWSAEEEAAGLPAVGLGPGILRAETAAVAAGTLMSALRAGLVAPA